MDRVVQTSDYMPEVTLTFAFPRFGTLGHILSDVIDLGQSVDMFMMSYCPSLPLRCPGAMQGHNRMSHEEQSPKCPFLGPKMSQCPKFASLGCAVQFASHAQSAQTRNKDQQRSRALSAWEPPDGGAKRLRTPGAGALGKPGTCRSPISPSSRYGYGRVLDRSGNLDHDAKSFYHKTLSGVLLAFGARCEVPTSIQYLVQTWFYWKSSI